MPQNRLNDVASSSANPGGGSSIMSAPNIEPYIQGFIDLNAATAPAAVGKLVRLNWTAANAGCATFQQSAANEPLLANEFGIVLTAAKIPTAANGDLNQAKGEMVTNGFCQALATSTTPAIAPGDLLISDAAGNLTRAAASPPTGTLVARALQALPINTSTPTLINVFVGGQ